MMSSGLSPKDGRKDLVSISCGPGGRLSSSSLIGRTRMRRLSTPRARRSRPHDVEDVQSEMASSVRIGVGNKLPLMLFCSFRLSLSLKRISPVASGGRQDIVPARDNVDNRKGGGVPGDPECRSRQSRPEIPEF